MIASKLEAKFYREQLELISRGSRNTIARRLAKSAILFWDQMRREGDIMKELKYIAGSPLPEYGGFHPQVVLTSKRAIREIRKLKRRLKSRQ